MRLTKLGRRRATFFDVNKGYDYINRTEGGQDSTTYSTDIEHSVRRNICLLYTSDAADE